MIVVLQFLCMDYQATILNGPLRKIDDENEFVLNLIKGGVHDKSNVFFSSKTGYIINHVNSRFYPL